MDTLPNELKYQLVQWITDKVDYANLSATCRSLNTACNQYGFVLENLCFAEMPEKCEVYQTFKYEKVEYSWRFDQIDEFNVRKENIEMDRTRQYKNDFNMYPTGVGDLLTFSEPTSFRIATFKFFAELASKYRTEHINISMVRTWNDAVDTMWNPDETKIFQELLRRGRFRCHGGQHFRSSDPKQIFDCIEAVRPLQMIDYWGFMHFDLNSKSDESFEIPPSRNFLARTGPIEWSKHFTIGNYIHRMKANHIMSGDALCIINISSLEQLGLDFAMGQKGYQRIYLLHVSVSRKDVEELMVRNPDNCDLNPYFAGWEVRPREGVEWHVRVTYRNPEGVPVYLDFMFAPDEHDECFFVYDHRDGDGQKELDEGRFDFFLDWFISSNLSD